MKRDKLPEGQTYLSIVLPIELKRQLSHLAIDDERKLSPYVRLVLQQHVEDKQKRR